MPGQCTEYFLFKWDQFPAGFNPGEYIYTYVGWSRVHGTSVFGLMETFDTDAEVTSTGLNPQTVKGRLHQVLPDQDVHPTTGLDPTTIVIQVFEHLTTTLKYYIIFTVHDCEGSPNWVAGSKTKVIDFKKYAVQYTTETP